MPLPPPNPDVPPLHSSGSSPIRNRPPLHASQQVLRNDAEGCVVELFVMPNTELRQELLSLGSTVEVLEPESLAEAIREEHRKATGGQSNRE